MRIVIVGAGEVGFHIAQKLASESKEVVIVDKNPGVLEKLVEHIDVQTIVGSGSSPAVLEQAGIKGADILLAVTDSDEINIIACTFANILAPGITKLARIRSEEYTSYREVFSQEVLGVEMVINPEVEVIRSIQRLLGAPGAVEVSEFAEGRLRLIGICVREESDLAGLKLMQLPKKIGSLRMIIGAIIRNEELIIPSGEDVIQPDDLIYFVCEEKHQRKILTRFSGRMENKRNILIIGGGNIGFRLAQAMEHKNYHTKLVELSAARCEELSEILNRTIILQGDGTDQDLLQEENIRGMDAVVTVTGDEETNILCSLLAKSLGAAMAITRINKYAYLPLVRAIGIEHTVSPRQSAVNTILHHIRKGKVISAVSIKDEAEVLEAIAQDKSDVVGIPIKDMKFPKGALILCIIRGEDGVVIPTGNTVIKPQDRIIILTRGETVSEVEKALTVTLERI